MKVIDLDNIKFVGINKKFYRNFSLTNEYRKFKELLILSCAKAKIQPYYQIIIYMETYHDIDAPIKVILDALETAEVIDNDRNVINLMVHKKFNKRGRPDKLEVSVGTYGKERNVYA